MPKSRKSAGEPDMAALVQGIVTDAEKLIGQQIDLLRSEVREELGQAKAAACSIGAGVGLAAAGGVLTTLMLVHGLNRATGLPLWSCFGLVGGLLGAAGVGLITAGSRAAGDVQLVPPRQTVKALQENLSWLKEQASLRAT